MGGAETKEKMERLRGWEMDLVVIDEAKSFSPDNIEYLIHDILKPALMSRNGQLWAIGTPGSILDGPFFWATQPDVADSDGRVHATVADPDRPTTVFCR
jgi:phage terminase large subunit-like protein